MIFTTFCGYHSITKVRCEHTKHRVQKFRTRVICVWNYKLLLTRKMLLPTNWHEIIGTPVSIALNSKERNLHDLGKVDRVTFNIPTSKVNLLVKFMHILNPTRCQPCKNKRSRPRFQLRNHSTYQVTKRNQITRQTIIIIFYIWGLQKKIAYNIIIIPVVML